MAIKLNPDYAEAFCTRAAIYKSMGKYQEAIADATMAHDLKANLGDAYMLEAAAYRNLNQYAEAEAALAKLNQLPNPESAFEEWHPNIDYTPYFSYLQMTVQQKFRPGPGAYAAVVPIVKIHRNGEISDLRLNNSTGDGNADRAALEAVRGCVPFRQTPAGSPPDFDVYIVLDAPVHQQQGQPMASQAAQGSHGLQQGAPAQSGAGAVNWTGAVNQGLNQGLNFDAAVCQEVGGGGGVE